MGASSEGPQAALNKLSAAQGLVVRRVEAKWWHWHYERESCWLDIERLRSHLAGEWPLLAHRASTRQQLCGGCGRARSPRRRPGMCARARPAVPSTWAETLSARVEAVRKLKVATLGGTLVALRVVGRVFGGPPSLPLAQPPSAHLAKAAKTRLCGAPAPTPPNIVTNNKTITTTTCCLSLPLLFHSQLCQILFLSLPCPARNNRSLPKT